MRRRGPVPLREYRPSDFASIWELDQQCFPPGIAYSKAELRAFLSRKTAEAIVAEADHGIVGFVVGCRRSGSVGQVITVDVAAPARRHGVGQQLLVELERRLCATGATRMELEVAIDNTAALGFYERLGYRKLANLPNYYRRGMHAWRMEKPLA